MKRIVLFAAVLALLAAVPCGGFAQGRGGSKGGISKSAGVSRGSSFSRGGSSRGSSFSRGGSSKSSSSRNSFSRGGSSNRGSSFTKSKSVGNSFGKRPTLGRPSIGKLPTTKRPSLGKLPTTRPNVGKPVTRPSTRPSFSGLPNLGKLPIPRPGKPGLPNNIAPIPTRPRPTQPGLVKPTLPTFPTKPGIGKPLLPGIGKPTLPPVGGRPTLPPIGKPTLPPIVKPPIKPLPPIVKPLPPIVKPLPPIVKPLPPIVRPFPPVNPGPWFPGPRPVPPVFCPGGGWGWGSCWHRPNCGFGFCYIRPRVVYVNPYCRQRVIGGCDYSIPVVPNPVVTDAGQTALEQAIAAFQQGDLVTANAAIELALKEMPGNGDVRMLHSLILFAGGNYTDAAAVAHAAMTASAGWTWETLVSMYPSVDVYTAQLRALEQASVARPDAADLRFLLGVHYLMCGHEEAATRELTRVNALQPKDDVSQQLSTMLAPAEAEAAPAAVIPAPPVPATEATPVAPAPAASATPAAPKAVPAPPAPMAFDDLTGNWTARPAGGVTITLSMQGGRFNWTIDLNGQKNEFGGTFTRTAEQLVLTRTDGEKLEVALGNVTANSFDLTPEGGQAMRFTR